MSEDLFESDNLIVNTFYAGEIRGKCSQFTLKGDALYEQLTREEIIELVRALFREYRITPKELVIKQTNGGRHSSHN